MRRCIIFIPWYVRTILVFFARNTASPDGRHFRTLCVGSTDDRHRQQQQQCRELPAGYNAT